MAKRRNVFTIPPGAPFAHGLARGLLRRYRDDPMALAAVTVLLPTRRACRALTDAFVSLSRGRALLLPTMSPIGDVDAEELALLGVPGFEAGAADIPPAIPELRRRLLLTRLVLRKAAADGGARPSPAQAAELAAELARLLDQVQTERLDFEGLGRLVPDDYARHWQITLEFLKIVTEAWPAVLAEAGCIDPADRRNRLIAARIRAWRAQPPSAPVIAAGSTGTIPATADLIAAVAELPAGEVVLPGFDTMPDAESRGAVGPTHPQFGMIRLIERLGRGAEDIQRWPDSEESERGAARAELVRHAMHPSPATAPALASAMAAEAIEGVTRVDCSSPQEEALVIALMLRGALETAGRTAALVTSDRGLARRVTAELRRWGIEIDDSAGVPLADTPPAVFLRLTAELAAEEAAPIPLLAALKHPMAAGGMSVSTFRTRVREFERAVLRGPRPEAGLAGLARALEDAEAEAELRRWFGRLAACAEPLMSSMGRSPVPVRGVLAAHVRFAEDLAATETETGAERLWSGDAGEETARLVDELAAAAAAMEPIDGRHWPAFLEAMMADRVVRPSFGRHPRLNIWGPLEARLQHADLIVLGGLNEGSWPREPAPDPWMSRPMRERFGLFPLERRVGLAAHDFAQAFGAEQVALTRSTRVEGTPTVPSRWLLRLDNTLARAGIGAALSENQPRWLEWQRLVDAPVDEIRIKAPAPCPPVAVRPRRLSVTQVETLRRDPYEVYARHILKLRPLDPIDADPGAADRGNFIHGALDAFVREFPAELPPDALQRLLADGRRAFGTALQRPGVRAFWWPRFERIAAWFIDHERSFRAGMSRLHSEVSGEIEIDAPAGPFVLTAKADRVDETGDARLSVADYKTGAPPSASDVRLGFAPQLPLEAVIAESGGFEGVPAAPVSALTYWRLSGGEPPGELRSAGKDVARLAAEARAGLESLIATFDDPDTPYASRPDPNHAPRYTDFEHLARVREWFAQGSE